MSNKEKQLAKNTIVYFIGNFGSKFLTFVLLPVYTHYLSKAEYGNYDMINTTVMLLEPLITLKLVDGIYRWLLDAKTDKEKSDIIYNGCSVSIRNIAITNIILLFIGLYLNFNYLILTIIYLDARIINSYLGQIARGLKKSTVFAVSGIIYTISMLILNIFFIAVLRMNIDGLLLSGIIANTISNIYLIIFSNIKKFSHDMEFNKKLRKDILRYSIPLIPSAINWWIMRASDRYILNYFLGVEANGVYAIANQFPSAITMINNIFYLAWQESSIIEYNSDTRDKFYSNMFNIYFKFQFTVVIGMIAFTIPMMTLLIDDNFFEAWKYTQFLYVGAMFNSFASFYATGYLSVKNTKGAFNTSIAGAIANIIVHAGTIHWIGIQAASLSTMIGFMLMWLLRVYETRKYFKIKINAKEFSILSIITTIYIITSFYYNIYVILIQIVVAIIIFFYYNRELIKSAVSLVSKKLNSRRI